jgi:hypothetical protein
MTYTKGMRMFFEAGAIKSNIDDPWFPVFSITVVA